MRLSGDQIRRYHDDGFLVSDTVLSPSEVEKIRAGVPYLAETRAEAGRMMSELRGRISLL
ncbi:hypothetical protein [Nocardia sp. NPDC051570]|uniref:hypothetical protein n=1 Tax=Nocardia sp. NPDC051570 TaxID=3364324 RepID=UPI0037B5FAE9